MIDQIKIQNFKSYQSATLKLAPLTMLIGANASGKSNAVEAIRFLSWLAAGRRLDDILQNVQQTDTNIRGGLANLTFNYAASKVITLGATLDNLDEWRHFSISIQLDAATGMRIIAESVTSDESRIPLYEIGKKASSDNHEVQVTYNNFAPGGIKPKIACSNRQAIFTQLDVPSRFTAAKSRQIIPDVAEKLQQAFRSILFLDPIPSHMGGYSFINDRELQNDGANVSSVLYDLCQKQDEKRAVLDMIRALPEQDILDVDFILTPRDEVMVQLIESFGSFSVKRDAPLLSDGTLRVLAVTAALLSAPQGTLIIIEEVDNGIHPSRARMVLENILNVATRRKLRVLLTSHNPALLDALPDSAIPHVVACYRDSYRGDSRLVRLEDLLEYPALTAQGPIGRLMTTGILDRFLKSQPTAEQQRIEGLEWFKLLQQQLKAEAA